MTSPHKAGGGSPLSAAGANSEGASGDGGTDRPATRILVAEDEFFVALLLEDQLRPLGFSIVGPYTSLADATHASRRELFDLAILDINLNGEMIYPLADELKHRGVPFIFVSGYGSANLPERHRDAPLLSKPYEQASLAREIGRCLAARNRR